MDQTLFLIQPVINSTPQYGSMAWCSVKAEGKILPFTFTQ